MRKFIVIILTFSILLQLGSIRPAEANGKLIAGIVLTGAGITAIIVGNEEVDVLKREYDFTTFMYTAIWDEVTSSYISEWWASWVDPDLATVVEKKSEESWAYGTNNYDIYLYGEWNHHKVYETEKRITILGKMGFVATGVGVTLLIDYLTSKTKIQQKAGLEIKSVVKPEYCGLALTKRY